MTLYNPTIMVSGEKAFDDALSRANKIMSTGGPKVCLCGGTATMIAIGVDGGMKLICNRCWMYGNAGSL